MEKRLGIEITTDKSMQFRAGDNTYRLFVKKDGSFFIVPRDPRKTITMKSYSDELDFGVQIDTKKDE